jgi:hypothetical protein
MDRILRNQSTEGGIETHAGETPLVVSVVIYTHNGAARLPQTLAHLAAQKDTGGVAWKAVLVDTGADAWSSSLR